MAILSKAAAPKSASDVLNPKATMKKLNLPPSMKEPFQRVVLAGMTLMFSAQTHQHMMTLLTQGPGTPAEKLGQGMAGLILMIYQKSVEKSQGGAQPAPAGSAAPGGAPGAGMPASAGNATPAPTGPGGAPGGGPTGPQQAPPVPTPPPGPSSAAGASAASPQAAPQSPPAKPKGMGAGGGAPGQVIIPAAIYLMSEAVDFLEKTGAMQLTSQDVSEAMELMIRTILGRFGIDPDKLASNIKNGVPKGNSPAAQIGS